MSTLKKYTVYTSDTHFQSVIVTAQRYTNDKWGNPRYKVQVWVDRLTHGGNLWCPPVQGYKFTKSDFYIIESYNIEHDLAVFMVHFQKAVRVK